MNAIVTVVGQDKVGIIAAVCTLLAENNVNILDISQTILQGSFTMVMAVDVGAASVSIGDTNFQTCRVKDALMVRPAWVAHPHTLNAGIFCQEIGSHA